LGDCFGDSLYWWCCRPLNTFIQTHNATNIRTSFVVFIGNGVTEEAYEDVKTGFFIEIFVGFSFAKPCGYRFPSALLLLLGLSRISAPTLCKAVQKLKKEFQKV